MRGSLFGALVLSGFKLPTSSGCSVLRRQRYSSEQRPATFERFKGVSSSPHDEPANSCERHSNAPVVCNDRAIFDDELNGGFRSRSRYHT